MCFAPVPAHNRTMNRTTLRNMWQTRPTRIPKQQGGNAIFAGVAEGFGARYQIDPLLIRLGFVFFTFFFGGGIFLYLMCWLCMPRIGLQHSPIGALATPKEQLPDAANKERTTAIWLIIALVFTFPFSFASTDEAHALATIASYLLAFGGWYALYRRCPEPPANLIARAPDVSAPAAGTTDAGTKPPAWDPLGAAPDLWYLPEPTEAPQPTQPTPRRRRIILIALAIVAVVGAGTALITVASAPYYANSTAVGDIERNVSSPEQIENTHLGIGDLEINYSQLGPLKTARSVEITTGIGDTEITLPTETKVKLNCAVFIGEQNCPAELINPDAEGETLTMNIRNGIGEIDIQ